MGSALEAKVRGWAFAYAVEVHVMTKGSEKYCK